MPEIELLAAGEGDYRLHAPDALRAWMRDRHGRDLVDQTAPAAGAAGRLDGVGDCASFCFSSFDPAQVALGRTATT
jgi:hypothetical protein